MKHEGDRVAVGKVVFDAWTDPAFAMKLINNPNETLAERNIRDMHGRSFVVLVDTKFSLNLVFPWLPTGLAAKEIEQYASNLLRVEWTNDELKCIRQAILKAWTATTAKNTKDKSERMKPVASWMTQPETQLAGAGIKPKRIKEVLNGRRIISHEDSAHIIHLVIPNIPGGKSDDLLRLKFDLMGSACCLCNGDNGDDEE